MRLFDGGSRVPKSLISCTVQLNYLLVFSNTLPEKLTCTEEMPSFRINSLQEGVSANGGFRLDVATRPFKELKAANWSSTPI